MRKREKVFREWNYIKQIDQVFVESWITLCASWTKLAHSRSSLVRLKSQIFTSRKILIPKPGGIYSQKEHTLKISQRVKIQDHFDDLARATSLQRVCSVQLTQASTYESIIRCCGFIRFRVRYLVGHVTVLRDRKVRTTEAFF